MMERLAELIGKLKEQFEQRADTSKLLATTMLIERELMKAEAVQNPPAKGSKVSVVMPAGRTHPIYQDQSVSAARTTPERSPEKAPVVQQATHAERKDAAEKPAPPPAHADSRYMPREVAAEVNTKADPSAAAAPEAEAVAGPQPKPVYAFDPMQEIPTLSHQQNVRELNELIGVRDPSLNDKFRENRVEVAHRLTDHPIKDLKKAIGINDRYLFINELFRGDEVMYERSI